MACLKTPHPKPQVSNPLERSLTASSGDAWCVLKNSLGLKAPIGIVDVVKGPYLSPISLKTGHRAVSPAKKKRVPSSPRTHHEAHRDLIASSGVLADQCLHGVHAILTPGMPLGCSSHLPGRVCEFRVYPSLVSSACTFQNVAFAHPFPPYLTHSQVILYIIAVDNLCQGGVIHQSISTTFVMPSSLNHFLRPSPTNHLGPLPSLRTEPCRLTICKRGLQLNT